MQRRLIPVVLSGGSGSRLWPLSLESRPKQFLPLLSARSLFQETLLRTRQLDIRSEPPIIICNEAHHTWVRDQSREMGIEPAAIVLEPVGRNTAAAVAVAALLAAEGAARPDRSSTGDAPTSGADDLLLVLPADHAIRDVAAFARALDAATAAADAGRLVTFGIVPDRPETGYGYIHKGESHGAWASVHEFVEKPDLATAEGYVASGRYLWNSGMFLLPVAAVLEELRVHSAPILDSCASALRGAQRVDALTIRLGNALLDAPSSSFDYAVMEKTSRGAVVPLAAGWSDVGSWSALHDVLPQDEAGNTVTGNVVLESCTRTYVAASGRVVAAIGLDNIVIVETADAVLVVNRDCAQDVKRVVDRLRSADRDAAKIDSD